MSCITNTKRILVVDDEYSVREFIVLLLEYYGYQSYQAADGQEAMQLFEKYRHDIALAIVDVCMPVMDGKATLKALNARNPDLPVLMMSGYSNQHIQARTDGCLGVLSKPFTANELKGYVNGALQA